MSVTVPIEQARIPLDAEQAKALLDCVPDPVLVMGADGAILYGNRPGRELEAWIRLDGPARNLAAELSAMKDSAGAGDPKNAVTVLRSASQVRRYRITSQVLPTVGGPDAIALVLSLVADHEQDPLHLP